VRLRRVALTTQSPFSRIGASKGDKARAKKFSKKRRSEIAKIAARTQWWGKETRED